MNAILMNFLGTNFENRLIDVLEKLSKKQDNSELELRLEKLEQIIENLSPSTSNNPLGNQVNTIINENDFTKKIFFFKFKQTV